MPKKLIMAVPVLLIVLGALYFFVLKGDGAPEPKPKVEGQLLPMTPEFLLNLEDGHMAKFNVTLLLSPKDHHAEAIVALLASAGDGAAPELPAHPQNSLIRSLITDELNTATSEELLSPKKRKKLLKEVQHSLHEHTDAHVTRVLISDLVVD